MWRILLVDDEEYILNALKRLLLASGRNGPKLQADTHASPWEALEWAREGIPYDLVISDYRMPELDGIAFLKKFREIQPDAARIILSGYTDFGTLTSAINEVEIFRFIPKPWNDFEVMHAVEQAVNNRRLLMENRRLADMVRLQQGRMSRQEMELRRLEEETPGITKVRWGPDGSVFLEDFE